MSKDDHHDPVNEYERERVPEQALLGLKNERFLATPKQIKDGGCGAGGSKEGIVRADS